MIAPSLLDVQGLGFRAPDGQSLLHDITFQLDEGAILAIAGPNGAGKTTLITLLAGLEQPERGDIYFAGQPLNTLSAQQKAQRIAVVSQQEQPDARLTLRDYVALGQIPIWSTYTKPDHVTALDEVLDITGLSRFAAKSMAQLSGGERQRAHIARALAQRPKLLFLDEPTNHLDPHAKGKMLSLIAELKITVVMILHDLVLIPEFATHVALLNNAQLHAFGLADNVLTPDRVRKIFGVDYIRLPHEGRVVHALDIRRSSLMPAQIQKEFL